MKIKSKIWLEQEGYPVFGSFRAAVLHAVQKAGSINKAAELLNVSYRKVWGHISAMESRLHQPLLIKNKGGRGGGGAVLTEYACELLEKFQEAENQIKGFADSCSRKVFGKNG